MGVGVGSGMGVGTGAAVGTGTGVAVGVGTGVSVGSGTGVCVGVGTGVSVGTGGTTSGTARAGTLPGAEAAADGGLESTGRPTTGMLASLALSATAACEAFSRSRQSFHAGTIVRLKKTYATHNPATQAVTLRGMLAFLDNTCNNTNPAVGDNSHQSIPVPAVV